MLSRRILLSPPIERIIWLRASQLRQQACLGPKRHVEPPMQDGRPEASLTLAATLPHCATAGASEQASLKCAYQQRSTQRWRTSRALSPRKPPSGTQPPSAVPLPAALPLFASALGLAGWL